MSSQPRILALIILIVVILIIVFCMFFQITSSTCGCDLSGCTGCDVYLSDFHCHEMKKHVEPLPLPVQVPSASVSSNILDFVKAPKYNFVASTDVDVTKTTVSTPLTVRFNEFQVWSPLHPKLNEKRSNTPISAVEFCNTFQEMKKKYNFEPTCYYLLGDKYEFFIATDCKVEDNKLVMEYRKMGYGLTLGKSSNVSLFIDAAPAQEAQPSQEAVVRPPDGSKPERTPPSNPTTAVVSDSSKPMPQQNTTVVSKNPTTVVSTVEVDSTNDKIYNSTTKW